MYGLKHRVGVEGFFCLVTNTPDFAMKPMWYFSNSTIEEFLKTAVRKGWDTEIVGTMLEAYAVAGCDFSSEYSALLGLTKLIDILSDAHDV